MLVPKHQRESYTWRRTAALAGLAVVAIALVMALVVGPAERAQAAASVTTLASATISADMAAPNPAYTTLTGPVVQETLAHDVGAGTIVLSPPAGFEFRTTPGSVNVSVSLGNTTIAKPGDCGSSGANATATFPAGFIAIEVCTASSSPSIITWSGIGVRPTSGGPFDGVLLCGAPIFPAGDIILDPTSTSAGVPIGTPLGHLAETSGAPYSIQVATPLLGPLPVNTINGPLTVCAEDQFGNGVVGAPMSWSISSVPPGATCQALITPEGTTNGLGLASTGLLLGHMNGGYQVTASSGALSVNNVTNANLGPGAPCAPTPTPTPAPTPCPTCTPVPCATPPPGATEDVPLAGTCNPLASTYADATPIGTIAGAVAPTTILTAIWSYDPFTVTWLGYAPGAPPGVNNLVSADRLDVIFICANAPGKWTRPVI